MNDYRLEYKKLENEINTLDEKLKVFPKGAIRKRIIKGKEYYYLQFRDGKQVRSKYIHRDEVEAIREEIACRKETEQRIKDRRARLERYAKLMGIHKTYRPVKDVDYGDYTLFMSMVAHDYKTLDSNAFVEKYDLSKFRGINKRYLSSFYDYINGISNHKIRRTNDLILDPYTYLMYFKYGQKEVLYKELEKAIPEFLSRGLLITEVQVAVNGTRS